MAGIARITRVGIVRASKKNVRDRLRLSAPIPTMAPIIGPRFKLEMRVVIRRGRETAFAN
jgi:hypothetical protein